MIRHLVLFTARDPADVDAIVDGLSLLTAIPAASRLEVARSLKTDRFDRSVDVVVYGEFADAAALSAYQAHPLYAEAIRRVRPLRDARHVADFATEAAVTAPLGPVEP